MDHTLRILGITGSLRKQSFNRSALRGAQQLAPSGAAVEILDLDLDGIPDFNEDEEQNFSPKVAELKQKIRAADAILIVTPEYNYSVPGVLKNAIDWASRPNGESALGREARSNYGGPRQVNGTARAQYHLGQLFETATRHADGSSPHLGSLNQTKS
jgi:chromate reductase